MGTNHARRFWSDTERHHDLVETYDKNIETTHPDYVTTDRLCPWVTWSKWCATAVKYREYRGPRVVTL